MKSSSIEKQGTKAKFEIEYSAEEFENALIEVYRETKDKFRIDGFRKGKAPRKLIMRHYGENIFDDDAVEKLLQKDYPATLIEFDIEPIDRPAVDMPELKHGEGFTVKFEVEISPEFDVKDFEGVITKDISYEATDEDVNKQLEMAQERGARLMTVEREAQAGDTVNIDYSGSIDGEKFDGGTGTNHNLKLGSNSFIEGFEDQLAGKKAGDEAEVKVTFPEEYHAESLAGKDAVFEVKVNEVRAEEKPELDDEFAQDISEFDTLDEFKADLKTKLQEQGKRRAEAEMKDAILQKIYDANEVEIPEVMVESQIDDMLMELDQEIRGQGGTGLEQFFKITNQTGDELREKMKDDAYRRTKMRLIIQNIARMQNFTASEEEVDEELDKMAEQYKMEKDEMRKILGDFQLRKLKEDIRNRKAVDYVYENAVTEEE